MELIKTNGITETRISAAPIVQAQLTPKGIEIQSKDAVVVLTDEELKKVVQAAKKDMARALKLIG